MLIWLSASALVRASAGGGAKAVLMVCGSRSVLLRPCPNAVYAVRRPFIGMLNAPVPWRYVSELSAHDVWRPCDGPPTVSGPKRSGLSHTTLSRPLSNLDPSQPNRAMPLLFDHSTEVFRSVVRWSSGIWISTALLK